MWDMTLPNSGPGTDHPSTTVGVLDRSMAILDAVQAGALTNASIARVTGLPRTTCHRLLTAMATHGLLEHVGDRGYRLGPRLVSIAAAAMHEPSLRDIGHPALERLSTVTGESAQLYVAALSERICVDAVESSSELRTFVRVGATLPMYAGSAGKVFLAWMPPEARAGIIAKARSLTLATPTGERLERQLSAARKHGWASSAGERKEGVGSVSAPVFDPLGELVAVVSISGPTSRVGRIGAKRYAPAVKGAAREIEAALGVG
jgi:DNA-binding IclR family transcriptional regulator